MNQEQVYQLTPIGAAALELSSLRGLPLKRVQEKLLDRFGQDCSCPVSALFDAVAVRDYYAGQGQEVNVVPLPRQGTM